MTVGPILTTARLILRPPTQADFPAFAEMMRDQDHVRFIGGAQPPAAAWRLLATITGAWVLKGYSMFSVIERESGHWVGRVGPWMPEGWPGCEVGWGLSKSATGKGYAVEAACASIDWAFSALGWTDVIHIIAPENSPSQAVAARLGSRNLGPTFMPEPFENHRVDAWGQSKAEWRAQHK